MAPPGIHALVHDKPTNQDTWSPHTLDGWYTGPALDSYRCYKIWIWETRVQRTCDTVLWFPTKVKMPYPSTDNLILVSLNNIVYALQQPSTATPVDSIVTSHAAKLGHITKILTNIITKRAPPLQPKPIDTVTTTKQDTTTMQ